MSGAWRFAAKSHVGLVRDGNEDAMYAGPRLLAVADGVGGSVAGEIASKIAITTLSPLDTDAAVTDATQALRETTHHADVQLRDAISADPSLAGMGTTLTAILWVDDQVALAQLGDSRAYRFRDGELSQLTRDQTLVQSLVDEGQITPEEALVHPRRSWILRALDGRGEADPDIELLTPLSGDRYLLCSDGLSDYVERTTIASTLGAGTDLQLVCDALVDHALAAGAPDNVTCIVAEPLDEGTPTAAAIVGGAAAAPNRVASPTAEPTEPAGDEDDDGRSQQRSIGRRLALVAVIVVLLVAAVIVGGTVYIRGQWYLTDHDGKVALYHGVEGKFVGISLSRLAEQSEIPTDVLQQPDRDDVLNGIKDSSRSGAQARLRSLWASACNAETSTPAPTAPTAEPSAHPTKTRGGSQPSAKPRTTTTPGRRHPSATKRTEPPKPRTPEPGCAIPEP